MINKDSFNLQCEVCQLSKLVRSSYYLQPYKPSHPFYLIHNDVCGLSRRKNISGARWFVSFIDGHTRIIWLFFIKQKSAVGQIVLTFHKMIQNYFRTKIQVLKTDNAREFFQSNLGFYVRDQGIIHLSSCVDSPRQNRVTERKNRHLLEVSLIPNVGHSCS